MACLLSNSLILHIPKTGSDWVRAACYESVEGPISEVGDWLKVKFTTAGLTTMFHDQYIMLGQIPEFITDTNYR